MSKYTIAQIKPQEINGYKDIILALWKDNLSNSTEERFTWFYDRNPYGAPVTWLAKDDVTGEFVGCNSLYPQEVRVGGERARLGIAVDFAINKKNRVFGPALQIERTIVANCNESGFDFAFAWPSQASSGVFVRAGYTRLGEVATWTKLLRSEIKIARLIKAPIFSKAIGKIVDLFLDFQGIRHGFSKDAKLKNEIISECDERFDAFYGKKVSEEYVSFVRSHETLNWRYCKCPYEKYLFFCLMDKRDGSLKGYIVYTVKNDLAIIWDIDALSGQDYKRLLIDFCSAMKKTGNSAVLFSFLGGGFLEKVLRRINFYKKEISRPGIVYCREGGRFSDRGLIFNASSWFLPDGLLDL